jgi:hypothetical protein
MFNCFNESVLNAILGKDNDDRPDFKTLLTAYNAPLKKQIKEKEADIEVTIEIEYKKKSKKAVRPQFIGDGIVRIGTRVFRVRVDLFGDHYILVDDTVYYIKKDENGKYLVKE